MLIGPNSAMPLITNPMQLLLRQVSDSDLAFIMFYGHNQTLSQ